MRHTAFPESLPAPAGLTSSVSAESSPETFVPNVQIAIKEDRRDRATRLEMHVCPACGGAIALPMARTKDFIYFGCDGCRHVWTVSKPRPEQISQRTTVLTRTD